MTIFHEEHRLSGSLFSVLQWVSCHSCHSCHTEAKKCQCSMLPWSDNHRYNNLRVTFGRADWLIRGRQDLHRVSGCGVAPQSTIMWHAGQIHQSTAAGSGCPLLYSLREGCGTSCFLQSKTLGFCWLAPTNECSQLTQMPGPKLH